MTDDPPDVPRTGTIRRWRPDEHHGLILEGRGRMWFVSRTEKPKLLPPRLKEGDRVTFVGDPKPNQRGRLPVAGKIRRAPSEDEARLAETIWGLIEP